MKKNKKKSHAKLIDNKEMIKNNPVFIQEMIKNTCIISLKFHYNGILKRKALFPHSHLVGWSGSLKSQTSRPPY